jgi:hypothetical protein
MAKLGKIVNKLWHFRLIDFDKQKREGENKIDIA